MRCLLLGGRGFIGRRLMVELVRQGHQVRVFDRPDPLAEAELRECGVEFVGGDFLNQIELRRALDGCAVVFHLLATTLPKSSNDDPRNDAATNTLGTLGLLDLLKDTRGIRVVFASSGGTIYGIPHTLPITESHPTDPLCAYGISKLSIEKYHELYARLHGLDYRVLRIANLYGEGQSPFRGQGAIAVFAYKALRAEPIEIWGDGSTVRDYLHIDDVVQAFMAAMSYAGTERIFNIGSSRGHSLNELLEALETTLQRRVERIYRAARGFDVGANVLDCSRARTALGWEPQVSLSVGIERTIQWLGRTYS